MQQDTHQTTPLLSWEGPAIGLLDLDAFFASCEELEHPEWRGKPVIVGGDVESRGVVSTANYVARTYGVKSAMSIARAHALCPDGIFVKPHGKLYKQMSNKVMTIIAEKTPYVEQVSIDEAFFDVTPGTYSHEDPVELCKEIQARVAELGVTCSIGLSTSKSVAKIASDMDKPRGLCVVPLASVRSFLDPLPIAKLSGVGPHMEQRLQQEHITTLGALARAPKAVLQTLGKSALTLQNRALGINDSHVALFEDIKEEKSISHEHTYSKDVEEIEPLNRTIASICDKLAGRLRAENLSTTCVCVKLKTSDFHSSSMQATLEAPSCSEMQTRTLAQSLLAKLFEPGVAYRLVGVRFSGLASAQAPLQLSFTEKANEKQDKLGPVKDSIQARFGKDAIKRGRDVRKEL